MQRQNYTAAPLTKQLKKKNSSEGSFSILSCVCVLARVQGRIWQATPPPHTPSGQLYGRHSVVFYMPLCLAKHLEPMSRADWAKCSSTESERTAEHAIMVNRKNRPRQINLGVFNWPKSTIKKITSGAEIKDEALNAQ